MTEDDKKLDETEVEAVEADAEEAVAEEQPAEVDPVAKLQAENAELKERLMRALADVENMRRRSDKEKQDAAKYGITPLAREILPVADNLRRALESLPAELKEGDANIKNLVIGIEMTEQQLVEAFKKCKIEKVAGQGEKFDYKIHQAMSEAVGTGQPAGTVVQELQGGYMLHDRLLRPAMVIVAKGDVEPAAEGDDTPHVDTTA